jgi:hypothetical protein
LLNTPGLIELGVVLAAVKHALRRLDGLTAMLDRGCARRRVSAQAGARKKPFQPNKETGDCLASSTRSIDIGRRQHLLR